METAVASPAAAPAAGTSPVEGGGMAQPQGLPATAGGPGAADAVNPATPIPADAQTALELDGAATTNANVPNEEGKEATMQDETTKESPVDQAGAVVKSLAGKLFEGREFSSDQEAAEAIEQEITENRAYIKQNTEANQRLIEIFKSSPELVDLIHLMNKGASLEEALPYVTGEAMADGEEYEAAEDSWRKAAQERQKAKSESDNLLKKISENVKVTAKNIAEFAKENSMTDDEAADFLLQMEQVMENVAQGNITKEIMMKFRKGLYFDKEVQTVAETAEIKGRNQAIDEIRGGRAKQQGDGLPHPRSTSIDPEISKEDNPAAFIIRNIESASQSRPF
jgi:hypothetical protein